MTLLGFDLSLHKAKGRRRKEMPGKVIKNTIRFYQNRFISKHNEITLKSLFISKINTRAQVDITHFQLR